jgi:hypothetical protein
MESWEWDRTWRRIGIQYSRTRRDIWCGVSIMPAIEVDSLRRGDPLPVPRQHSWKSWLGASLRVGAVLFCCAIGADVIRNGPEAKEMEQRLRSELSQIPPPDAARLIDSSGGSKPRQAHAERTYRCSLNAASVAEYYDRQLRQRGWSRIATGSSLREYRKNSYRATLEFRRDADWDFAIGLEWRRSP